MPPTIGLTGITNSPYVESYFSIADIEAISKDMQFKALPIMMFMQFADKEVDLLAAPGTGIKMHKIQPIPRGRRLIEGKPIVPVKMTGSDKVIQVSERGNAIQVTSFLKNRSPFDQIGIAAKLLADDYAVLTDSEFRDVCYAGFTSPLYAGGKTSRALLTSADKFDEPLLLDGVLRLITRKVPMFSSITPSGIVAGMEHYVCFIHPNQARAFTTSPEFVNVVKYSDALRIYRNEIGMWRQVRFVQTTQIKWIDGHLVNITVSPPNPNIGNQGSIRGRVFDDEENRIIDSVNPLYPEGEFEIDASFAPDVIVYKAIMFGAHSYGFAEADPATFRDGGIIDLGRQQILGWVSEDGIDTVNDDYGCILESA